MKFLTMNAWQRVQVMDVGPWESAAAAYRTHLDCIRPRLPRGLVELLESITLHDARLESVDVDTSRRSVRLHVQAYGSDVDQGRVRKAWLSYTGVSRIQVTNPENGFRGHVGFGDVGYDEIDITEAGQAEHRILFASGIELALVFEALSVVDERGPGAR
jgi:hypothetical protein